MTQARPPRSVPPLSDVEERAWFGLMGLVAIGLPEVERTIREHGLVHIEYLLLADLATAPDGKRMSELAHCLQASPSRLSHRIRKLVDLGYASQQPSTRDGRVIIATVTETGRRVVEQITPAHLADVRRVVFDPLTPEQVTALAEAMTAIGAHAKATAMATADDA